MSITVMSPAKLCFLILACFAGAGFITAFGQEPCFIHYNTGNSALPHDVCYELMQDKKGYLWAGTDNGMVRFDGRDMKIYRQCFRSPFVTVASEYDSCFLIAAWTGGIYRLAHDMVIQLRSPDPEWLAGTNRILQWKDFVLLYCFNKPGYFRFNKQRDSLLPVNWYLADTDGRITKLPSGAEPAPSVKYCILNDRLIAYGDKGIFFLEDTVFRKITSLPFDHVIQAANGKIYGFRTGCVYTLSRNLRASTLVYNLQNIAGIAGLKASDFTVLASGNLLLRLSHSVYEKSPAVKCLYVNCRTKKARDLQQMLHLDVLISDMIADRESGFWVGTDGSGIYHVFESPYRQYGGGSEFSNSFVTALAQAGPRQAYIGTKNGVYLLNGNRLQLVHPGVYVKRFCKDADGSISVQMYEGDNLLIKNGRAEKLAENIFRTATAHYIITDGPRSRTVSDKDTRRQLVQATRNCPGWTRESCEDNDGCMWYGSDAGLYWWRSGDTAAIPYPCALPGINHVTHMAPDPHGGLWVSTAEAGLYYLQHRKILAAYNELNGLSNGSVRALLPHAGKLWIGTPGGLRLLNPRTGHMSVYKKYDGLIAGDVTALAAFSDSEIVAGSSSGITVFRDDRQETSVLQPQLTLEQVAVDDRVIRTSPAIVAGYRSRIALTYNVVSFVYPELVRFQYRLSGNDPWIETANKSIVLTNLAPGNYCLQVRACRYNSEWSRPLELALEIQKPWWRTIPFYGTIGLLTAVCICILLRSHSAKTHSRLLQRQQFAELKLKALQAQLNPHFVSNALSAIQFFTLVQDEAAASDYLARFAGLTRLLLESSCSRFVPLKDELQIVTHYFELEKLRFKNMFTYSIEISPGVDTGNEWLPGVLLQPFVENSINHGIVYLPKEKQGHVTVRIGRRDEMLLIEITDNGIGRRRAGEIQRQVGSMHKSRSAEIITEISQSVNNLEGCRLHISITDITDQQGNAAGTRVNISCLIANKHKPHYANSNYRRRAAGNSNITVVD